MSIFYVTRILDKGTRAESLMTWEGPFNTRQEAQERLNRLNVLQPQFVFFIEEETDSIIRAGEVPKKSTLVL
jgi:hypothetical protein